MYTLISILVLSFLGFQSITQLKASESEMKEKFFTVLDLKNYCDKLLEINRPDIYNHISSFRNKKQNSYKQIKRKFRKTINIKALLFNDSAEYVPDTDLDLRSKKVKFTFNFRF